MSGPWPADESSRVCVCSVGWGVEEETDPRPHTRDTVRLRNDVLLCQVYFWGEWRSMVPGTIAFGNHMIMVVLVPLREVVCGGATKGGSVCWC